MKIKSTVYYLFLLLLLPSCVTIQDGRRVVPLLPGQTASQSPSTPKVAKRAPSSESYFHTIVGLQYEAERSFGSRAGSNTDALKEYLIALKYDPDAFFLLKRIATLYSRLGNQKDALLYAEKARQLKPSNLELHLLLGDIYTISREYEEGLRAYQDALQFTSNKRDVYFKIAGIYANQGLLDKAEEMVKKGIDVGPPSPIAYNYLGMIALEKGELLSGLEYYEEALALDAFFEPAHMGIATIYERQKRIKDAIDTYWHIINRINPRNRQAINRLVQLMVQERSLDDALNLLVRLYKDDPSNMDISLQMSRVYVEKRDFPSAIKTLLPIVGAIPNDIKLQVYLATLYEENNEIDKALSIYKAILDVTPSEYDVRMRLGALYFYKMKNVSEALGQGELAKKIDPKREESYLFSGLVFHDSERYLDAAKMLSSGIEKNPEAPELHFHLGAAFDKLERFDDMVHEMEETIRLSPSHAGALNYLGYTFADKGIRLNEAVDLISRAIALQPDDGYFIDSLGWAYYRKGNLADAVRLLEKAVSLVPSDPVIYEHLGEVYLKDKRLDRAMESWKRSLALDPGNEGLIARFRKAGFGPPPEENSAQKLKTPLQDVQ